MKWMNGCICLDSADQQEPGNSKRNPAASSAECPHLQLHDSEVIGFWEATVVESVAGAAATQVQILIHPQTKVTTASTNSKGVQISFYKEGVLSSPSEALETRMQHEEECFSCAVERLTEPQRVRKEGPECLIKLILDYNEDRGVCGTEFPVEGLEASAMTGCTVSQLPAAGNCPRRKLLT